MSDADAAILGGAIGGLIGGALAMVGVWVAYYLGRRGSEADRRTGKLLIVYNGIESLSNLLIAVQKQLIDRTVFYRKWACTTEDIMRALLNSGLDRKRILKAINGKWNDPASVTVLTKLADDLLDELDPEYALAASEMLKELGVERGEINPIVP